MNVETIDELLCTSDNLKNEGYWMHCSHICWEGLTINCLGQVMESPGNSAVLDDPAVYAPIVESICMRWRLSMVWSFRSYAEDPNLLDYLSNPVYANNFWHTLIQMCTNRGIRIIEIDINTLAVVLCSSRNPELAIRSLCELGCSLWVVVDNMGEALADSKMEFIMNTIMPLVEVLVLNSFGFLKVKYLNTSHGKYRSMEVYPESSLNDFESLLENMRNFAPNHVQILMGISTSGIEYAAKSTDSMSVDKYRHLPLSCIRHRKRFGNCRFVESYDHDKGASTIEFPEDKVWISYDNENVLSRKLQFVNVHNLGGVVIGSLEDDISPHSANSLLKKCANGL